MAGDLRVVYAARTMQDAHLLRNFLEEQGIRAIVTNTAIESGAGVDVLGWATLARVAVNEENATRARQIAEEFDRTISPRGESDDADEAAVDEMGVRAEAGVREETLSGSWPRCPGCRTPRITKCPACGTSGTGFPRADDTGEAEPEAVPETLLLCIECDEPFVPEYASQCEWCGHEFSDGFSPTSPTETDTLSPGLLAVAGATLAVVVGLLVYFAVLLGHSATP